MRVLNLVTTETAEFFTQQVRKLSEAGIGSTTLAVPGEFSPDETESRSIRQYARFYTTVLRESLGDYDIVHANFGLTGPHALAQPVRPVVLSLWGTDLLGRYSAVSKLCARLADAVVVMNDEMAGLLDVDCHVIPHGVDLERFAPTHQTEAQTELGWSTTDHHVLFPYPPGRAVKNYPRAERIVDAVDDALDDAVELHVLTGIPHQRMPVYMNAADCLLLTSKREGSPNSVKEALACDLPIVSTAVGDVAQRLDGVTPSYVCRTDEEFVDCLVDVLERGVRSNGREAAREVSVVRTNERLRAVYGEVLDARSGSV